jgi:hypothetical protein
MYYLNFFFFIFSQETVRMYTCAKSSSFYEKQANSKMKKSKNPSSSGTNDSRHNGHDEGGGDMGVGGQRLLGRTF